MSKRIILFLSSLLIASCSPTYQYTKYYTQQNKAGHIKKTIVTYELPSIVNPHYHTGGWITKYNSTSSTDDFSIDTYSQQERLILVFNQYILTDDKKRETRLLDYIELPYSSTPPVSHPMIVETCRANNNNDSKDNEIFALISDNSEEKEQQFTKFDKAWRANHLTGKIEEISTRGLSCYNEGYGLDCIGDPTPKKKSDYPS